VTSHVKQLHSLFIIDAEIDELRAKASQHFRSLSSSPGLIDSTFDTWEKVGDLYHDIQNHDRNFELGAGRKHKDSVWTAIQLGMSMVCIVKCEPI
jgi:hypothetical protein